MSTKELQFSIKEIPFVLSHFNTTIKGLSNVEAGKRLKHYGPNEVGADKASSPIFLFLKQFKNVMVYVLFIASIISFYYNHPIDAFVILSIVCINALVGFIQEYKAEKAISALKKLVVQKVKTYRDGKIQEIDSQKIVPGDVLLLEEGDKVPADARIISSFSMQTQESVLTGESFPIDKVSHSLPEGTEMAELTNMVLGGSVVVRGFGNVVVVATGLNTFLGKIAKDIQHLDEETTHLQSKNFELTRQMAGIAFVSALVTFLVGYFVRGLNLAEILPFTLAALVSAIPESLPLVLMIVITISAHRMAKRNAIVRHLTAAETLGVVNVIITDKTGTLTQNKMAVQKIIYGQNAPLLGEQKDASEIHKKDLEKLATISLFCNNLKVISVNEKNDIAGDPTEKALFVYAKSANSHLLSRWEKLEDFPFNPHQRIRASICKNLSSHTKEIFVTGAPESILNKCSHILINGKAQKLNLQTKKQIENYILNLTGEAMRVIALAYKPHKNEKFSIDNNLSGLIWSGAVGLFDPPRDEALESVKKAQKAGIKVIMATGDHPSTALAIAKAVGIQFKSYAITGVQMETMSDKEVLTSANENTVFARMTPQSKLRLANILQNSGKVLAMTGDGVNDAPALKGANIGISMGLGGTDVAREASDIILADDNFATIIAAIEEGRTQFRNIRRTSFFLITTNIAESVSLLAFLFLGLPIPLLPKQVLWLNLVGGGLTDLALATEPIHEDVLDFPPRSSKEKIITKQILPQLVLFTSLMVAVVLLVHFLLGENQSKSRTGVFVALSLMQLFNLYNMRSLKKSIFEIGVFSNKQVNLAFLVSVALLLAVIYIPFLANLFEFTPLSMTEFVYIALASLLIIVLGEGIKLARSLFLKSPNG